MVTMNRTLVVAALKMADAQGRYRLE